MPFIARPTSGYWIKLCQEYPPDTECFHGFGGRHGVRGAWCPNCQHPLTLILKLYAPDPVLDMMDIPLMFLHLLYCWQCAVAQGDFSYRIVDDFDIEILHAGVGGVQSDFPYEGYARAHPESAVALVPVSGPDQRTIAGWNRDGSVRSAKQLSILDARHQLGGEPWLAQPGEAGPSCCRCGQPQPFLASIGDESTDPRGLIGCAGVQVLYFFCRSCRVLTARNRSD